jgi:hypothetical protein
MYVIVSPDSLGQIVGRVTNAPGPEVFVNILPRQGDKIVGKAEADGTFYIDRLFPGVYRIQAFYDKNNNGAFDGGGIHPLKYAEPIAIYPDTVQVRARWETDIGSIDFKPQMIDVDTLH